MSTMLKTLGYSVMGFALGAGVAGGSTLAFEPHHATQNPSIYQKVTTHSSPTLPIAPDTIANVVKRVSPAIVKIVATHPNGQVDIGTGFFLTSSGELVTNDHVIYGANHIQVDVPGYKTPFTARVLGTDYISDLAALKISAPKPLPTLQLGSSSKTPVGSWAIAIGNPYDLNHTVTVGVISAKGRPLTIGQRQYPNLLQTSAAINPGNSGGPLLNLKGQVVGINTAVSTQGQGIGFAIPVSTVKKLWPQLIKYGHAKEPWLGVVVTTDTPVLARQFQLPVQHGVAIGYVVPGSSAAKAGLHAGEVITKVNNQTVNSATGLEDIINHYKVGQQITLTLQGRHGSTTKTLSLGEAPNGPISIPQALF
ncbi:serine protease, S1-C subfamily, contains C-terminal PDZ domain [Sulfobacillus thermosulfidooxidans DSM 9293]|uniref:Serine protease, S1-C subfamily, contains C-terminal PDZ domain n=2 Tax=Sulfobacillus thermosulfidooxidans TaxID=28034 RepID=A0A1W1WIX0_SULTA|nr:trypsin-like peptidase domain-containing protein [Sulfobacillus thermosulfidooxidans]PSR29180.1 MAG: PDZ domain-containing protein [Sulfobacillus thermosulfidooxidans]SMC06261.1 serine protease, S1-C subfamily, contains C-terminal PDZ domain [Sulfobacillus thermosulfidooxidans DSM 9293]